MNKYLTPFIYLEQQKSVISLNVLNFKNILGLIFIKKVPNVF